MPALVSSLRRPRCVLAAAAAWLALGGLQAAHAGCLSFVEAPHLPPKSSEAAVFYIPPSQPSQTKAFSSDCSPIGWSGTVAGPGSTGPAFVGWAYSGAAQASPAAAHVAATSQRVGAGDAGAAGSVGVSARSVLPFTLQPLTAAAAGNLFSLQFDVIGEGEYGGSSVAGKLGSASVHLHASGGVGFTEVVDELYSDSNGWVHNGAGGSIGGPSALVQLSISYLAGFAAGGNAFQLDLDTLVSGQAFSDFAHTAKITGITLLSDDVKLLLPDGYFIQDGARHWSLLGDGSGGGGNDPDPLTVPEPGTAALALAAAGLVGGCRRRRRTKPTTA